MFIGGILHADIKRREFFLLILKLDNLLDKFIFETLLLRLCTFHAALELFMIIVELGYRLD